MRILRAPQSRAFVISKACAMLSGKFINKQTGEPLKICMHHMTSPDPCMNNGINCPIRKATTKKVAR